MLQERPNVVYVFADQWRAQDAGYAGNRQVRTPHLDRLAAQSVNFTYAVAGIPVCCPARATLLTGQHALDPRRLCQRCPSGRGHRLPGQALQSRRL